MSATIPVYGRAIVVLTAANFAKKSELDGFFVSESTIHGPFLSYFCNPRAICRKCVAWGIKEIAAPGEETAIVWSGE